MTVTYIPKVLYENTIAEVLTQIRYTYGLLTHKGYIYGIIVIDQDAKIIAVDPRFDKGLNYWDLGSIGAALYGVARQAQDFFTEDALVRATLIYNDIMLFVKSIGIIDLPNKGPREILVVMLVNNEVNLGVLILQMNKFGAMVRDAILKDHEAIQKLEMSEEELKETIRKLKKTLFEGS
jgi:hypothetical protein